DEPDICELLALTLGRMEIDTHSAQDLQNAKALLKKHEFDLCLTDMKLPDGNGIELVEYLQQNYTHIPAAVITAHGNMQSAITALKAGAFDFVSKPVDLQILRKLVKTALKLSNRTPQGDRRTRDVLLGDSPSMRELRGKIAKVARSQAPIYIAGESGTGKELVAKMIHAKGPRAENAFIPINCGAIPSELMESEFFGHKKGSFTGATSDKQGLFQAADGGTLFLDEVADLPLNMQVKLLRVIQEKAVKQIGASQEQTVDVRILSATHKDLSTLVDQGKFRQDLFYRINVIELTVPPLRGRRDDVPVLIEHVLDKLAQQSSSAKPALTNAAARTLQVYSFPGNVRELENILERAMTLCDNNTIDEDDLQLNKQVGMESTIISSPDENLPLEDMLGHIEKEAILNALEETKQNKTAAAKLLGMSFRALRYRLKKLGLD
ncbi:MAG: sigma-54-dependent Fis family transcriptional regulator, partial [Gammaproteobacteria bacterium]|nr:sigma-54-dependent Fis family transcriptional regulator [Gammaproteobacteria bacterium]